MDPTTGELLQSGLLITALGMGLVFASLAVLWGLLRLLTSVLPDKPEPAPGIAPSTGETVQAERQAAESLTAERAQVAAVVAGAVLSGALPLLGEVSTGSAFEYGRPAPSWLASNRARPRQPWQPSRAVEQPCDHGRD